MSGLGTEPGSLESLCAAGGGLMRILSCHRLRTARHLLRESPRVAVPFRSSALWSGWSASGLRGIYRAMNSETPSGLELGEGGLGLRCFPRRATVLRGPFEGAGYPHRGVRAGLQPLRSSLPEASRPRPPERHRRLPRVPSRYGVAARIGVRTVVPLAGGHHER